jgi:hypothetical protein
LSVFSVTVDMTLLFEVSGPTGGGHSESVTGIGAEEVRLWDLGTKRKNSRNKGTT